MNNILLRAISTGTLASVLFLALSSVAISSETGRPLSHSFLYDKYPELRVQAEQLPFFDDGEEKVAEIKKENSPDSTFE